MSFLNGLKSALLFFFIGVISSVVYSFYASDSTQICISRKFRSRHNKLSNWNRAVIVACCREADGKKHAGDGKVSIT